VSSVLSLDRQLSGTSSNLFRSQVHRLDDPFEGNLRGLVQFLDHIGIRCLEEAHAVRLAGHESAADHPGEQPNTLRQRRVGVFCLLTDGTDTTHRTAYQHFQLQVCWANIPILLGSTTNHSGHRSGPGLTKAEEDPHDLLSAAADWQT
jgi:hypothetical protein